jgi:hypothetical protein
MEHKPSLFQLFSQTGSSESFRTPETYPQTTGKFQPLSAPPQGPTMLSINTSRLTIFRRAAKGFSAPLIWQTRKSYTSPILHISKWHKFVGMVDVAYEKGQME